MKTGILQRLGCVKVRQIFRASALDRCAQAFARLEEAAKPKIDLWDCDETEATFNDVQLEEVPRRSVRQIVEEFVDTQKENLIGEEGAELLRILREFLAKYGPGTGQSGDAGGGPAQGKKKPIPAAPPIKKKVPPAPPLKSKRIPAPPPLKKVPPPPPLKRKGIPAPPGLKKQSGNPRVSRQAEC